MKVLHVGTLYLEHGGPALSQYLSEKGLIEKGAEAPALLTPQPTLSLIGEDVPIYTTKPARAIGLIPGLSQTLDEIDGVDLYHIQSIWTYAPHAVATYARRRHKPYIITPRGSLYPQALCISKWKKRLSMCLYQREDLTKATCIIATCEEEMLHYRALGFTNPVAILPNPIEVRGTIEREVTTPARTTIGYLGRLHPRKRVERLIYAFAELGSQAKNAKLVIIGKDLPDYEEFLRAEVKRLKLNNVEFAGFVAGREKDELLSSLSYLANPSDFENFGNVISEALVRGIPVLATTGAPWKIVEDYGCGWWIDNDQKSVTATVAKMLAMPEQERLCMGKRGKQLMKDRFSVEANAERLLRLYSWLLGRGERPDFVYN